MGNLLTGQNIFDAIVAIGIIAYGLGQWRSGKAEKRDADTQTAANTVQILSARADAFEKELKEAQIQHQANHDEIIRLQEANKHLADLNNQYLDIIKGRNPEMELLLKEIRGFLNELNNKIGDGHFPETVVHTGQIR